MFGLPISSSTAATTASKGFCELILHRYMLTCRVCIFVFLSEKGANKHPIVVKIPIATAIRTGNIIIAFEWATSLGFRFMSVSNLLPKRNLVFLHFVHQGRPWHAETSRSAEMGHPQPIWSPPVFSKG